MSASQVTDRARAIAKLQSFLDESSDPDYRHELIHLLRLHGFISNDAAKVLFEHNQKRVAADG